MTTLATKELPGDLFFQQPKTAEPPPLEMFVRVREPNNHHFYCRHLSFADFAGTFEDAIRPMEALVCRMPPSLLNPNYWEPLTRENERAVLEKTTAAITRHDGERTLLWRSDAIARGRLLRDGLDVAAELVQGLAFRVSGEGLLRLGDAWDGQERFEWAAFSELPQGDGPAEKALNAQADLASFRLGSPQERILFSSPDGRSVRLLFSERPWLRRAVSAAIRGFVVRLSSRHCAALNDAVTDRLVRLGDGLGFSCDPARDFTDRGRTCELIAHLGRIEWGVQLPSGEDTLEGDEKVLVYYDRSSGIWAVA